jgi:hypothetical protein
MLGSLTKTYGNANKMRMDNICIKNNINNVTANSKNDLVIIGRPRSDTEAQVPTNTRPRTPPSSGNELLILRPRRPPHC